MKVTNKGKKSPEEFIKRNYSETSVNVYKKNYDGGFVLVDLNNRDVILFVQDRKVIDDILKEREELTDAGLIEKS